MPGWVRAILFGSSLLAATTVGDMAVWVQGAIGVAIAVVLGFWGVLAAWDKNRRSRQLEEDAFQADRRIKLSRWKRRSFLAMQEIEQRRLIDIADAASLTAQLERERKALVVTQANLVEAQKQLRDRTEECDQLQDELRAANTAAIKANQESLEILRQAQHGAETRLDLLHKQAETHSGQIPTSDPSL